MRYGNKNQDRRALTITGGHHRTETSSGCPARPEGKERKKRKEGKKGTEEGQTSY